MARCCVYTGELGEHAPATFYINKNLDALLVTYVDYPMHDASGLAKSNTIIVKPKRVHDERTTTHALKEMVYLDAFCF